MVHRRVWRQWPDKGDHPERPRGHTAHGQFQTAHFKSGSELNFGLFRLGSEELFKITPPCDEAPASKCPDVWPVYCLSTNLDWLPGSLAHRADALASAWHGIVDARGLCKDDRRLLDRSSAVEEDVSGSDILV